MSHGVSIEFAALSYNKTFQFDMLIILVTNVSQNWGFEGIGVFVKYNGYRELYSFLGVWVIWGQLVHYFQK